MEAGSKSQSSAKVERSTKGVKTAINFKKQMLDRFLKQNPPSDFNVNFLNNALNVYEETGDDNVRDMIVENLEEMDTSQKYVVSYNQNGRTHHIALNQNTIRTVIGKMDRFQASSTKTYGSDQLDNFDIDEITDFKIEKIVKTRQNDGAFFPYSNETTFDLTRYQIYKQGEDRDDEHCIMFALRKTEKFTSEELQQICLKLVSKSFPRNKLSDIADILNCRINLSTYLNDKINTTNYGKNKDNIIYLGLYEDHYFINETCPIHLYAVRNRDKYLNDPKLNEIKKLGGSGKPYYNTSFEKKTIHIIKEIKETNGFKILSFSDFKNNVDYQALNNRYKTFELIEDDCEFIETKLKTKFEVRPIYFADFEATTDGKFHNPFMVSWVSIDDDGEVQNAVGEDCTKVLLNAIPDNSIIYFHNLKYDFQHIFRHCNLTGDCEKDGQYYSIDIRFYKKKFTLRDSYKMISSPLKAFSKIFSLECKKEVMPYDLYTKSSVKKLSIDLLKVEEYYNKDTVNGTATYQEFLNVALPYITINDKNPLKSKFRHIEYATYYCNQDVRVLKEGFCTFRKWCQDALNMDIINYLTLPSMADQYFIKEGCYDKVSQLTGSIRAFVQEAVVGGRVMTKDNKKWHLKEKIQDFDGVSLYPSAMARLPGYPIGVPKIGINTEADYYVVEIKVKSIEKEMDCPTFSYQNKQGIRVWDHSIPEDNIIVDKITLEDMVTFHDAKYEVIRGVYWDQGFNSKITEQIKEVFNLRLKYKSEKNPIEVIFKLLMNSAYGKTIMKPSDDTSIFKAGKEAFDKYLQKNINMIKSYEEYPNQDPKWHSFKIKTYVSMNKHVNRAHCGAMILSMSKRIMNEVVYAAKLSDCPIYYSDTDSTHILDDRVQPLADKYQEIYGRQLIGKQLGQFHCDFANDCYATETIIVDKKIYCDRLSDGTFHFRCKGVSGKSIEYEAKQNYGGDICAVYASKKEIEFDLLCDNQVKFEFINGQGVMSNKKFTRKIHF